ncbi:MAG TPA: serine protease [Phycisphaerae bacterium]|nr:serine protease [Phycisphaerae bacterium]HRY66902.1 serine protease [Phycisphaerae bacterium]HSA27850.1 serine protease [Phycisphaerae bacterium]
MRTMAMALCGVLVCVAGCSPVGAPEGAIIREYHGTDPEWIEQAKKLKEAGRLLEMKEVKAQLRKSSCQLSLPLVRSRPLSGGELWSLARNAHVRVGYYFLCSKCSKWHFNVAGGYAITADGAVATCFHVVDPQNMKEGYLLAVTDAGDVLPVTEILAGSRFTDSCIVRIAPDKPLRPLPLSGRIAPGDDVWCYSDPANRPGFFSRGMVNRIYQHLHPASSKERYPVRINVSVEGAPGSSGAAVLDRFGNAVAHFSAVSVHGEKPRSAGTDQVHGSETVMVFHDTVRAADVLALIKP